MIEKLPLDYSQAIHEEVRRKLWTDVVVGVSRSSNSTKKESPVVWADYMLEEFDRRFKCVDVIHIAEEKHD